MVTMAHVDLAVTEMFRAVHIQLLGNACRLEKILLAALVIETRATGMGFEIPSHTYVVTKGLHEQVCICMQRCYCACLRLAPCQ